MKHELELIEMIGQGIPEKAIADRLKISQRAVAKNIAKLKNSYNAVDKANLIGRYIKMNPGGQNLLLLL